MSSGKFMDIGVHFRREENAMFNELLESTLVRKNTNKSWTVVLSTLAQTIILGVLVLIPLIYTAALPRTMLSALLIAPPPPPRLAENVKTPVRHGVRTIRSDIFQPPSYIPTNVVMVNEPEPPPDMNNDPPINGAFTNVPGQGIIGSNSPALPAPAKPAGPTRIKQGGIVTAASILSQTRPVYPVIAHQARIQGNVVLHAIIGKD